MNSRELKIIEQKNQETDKVLFGFWVYLMTDLIMFGVLFATYAVLHNNTFGGPGSRELFSLPLALSETLILLTSSFVCGLGMVFARNKDKTKTVVFFTITFLLGLSFLGIELWEFSKLLHEGNSFTNNAFLSSFFTLVGIHGLHIASGLLWIGALLIYIQKKGLTGTVVRKLTLFSLLWHFLDIVWIFIFTIVYLMGKI